MKGTAEGPLAGIWPPGRLELAEWRELLDALAADAERMIGRPGTLQESCTLALRWVGLAWPCMSAEVIAASCRASLQLGEPPGVVVGLPLADQLQEIAERLDSIYEAAQADHSALAVEVRAPVLLAAPGVLPEPEPPKPRKPRRRAGDPDPVEVAEPTCPRPSASPTPWRWSTPSPSWSTRPGGGGGRRARGPRSARRPGGARRPAPEPAARGPAMPPPIRRPRWWSWSSTTGRR
jgi:hypothetical protein